MAYSNTRTRETITKSDVTDPIPLGKSVADLGLHCLKCDYIQSRIAEKLLNSF